MPANEPTFQLPELDRQAYRGDECGSRQLCGGVSDSGDLKLVGQLARTVSTFDSRTSDSVPQMRLRLGLVASREYVSYTSVP